MLPPTGTRMREDVTEHVIGFTTREKRNTSISIEFQDYQFYYMLIIIIVRKANNRPYKMSQTPDLREPLDTMIKAHLQLDVHANFESPPWAETIKFLMNL